MTNEELSQKILNDIQYIKDKFEVFQKKLVDLKLDKNQLQEIQSVLNYFRTADFTFISNINDQKGLLNFENLFSSYKISIESLLDTATTQRLNNFLTNNSKIYEFIDSVINTVKEQFTPLNQEDESEERIQLKSKILDDINYLNSNSEMIQTLVREDFDEKSGLYDIDRIFYFIRSVTNSYLDKCTNSQLHAFYALSSFRFSAGAYSNNRYDPNVKTSFINSIKPAIIFIENLQNINVLTDDGAITKQNDLQNYDIKQEIQNVKKNINDLQSTEAQIEIRGFLTQAKELLDKAKGSENLLNGEIQELKQAKEGHIAYNLSKELQYKSDDLKNEYQKKIGSLSWKPWEFSGFYGAIAILLLVNLISWIIYFNCELKIEFWHFMMLKLTINIPLIIYVAFALNEYTKAKKLYEEFDYKRILAQTLMNNYNQFKTDFTDDQDKLLDLIKAPLEKIFDNPVHSIYGDKSGDKNIGLDQLEKITSIIEKMKK